LGQFKDYAVGYLDREAFNVVNEVYKNSGISGLINHLIELKHE